MTHDLVNNQYFDWMYALVRDDGYSERLCYHELLAHLHSREFTYILDMDVNRAEDGVSLRYRFGHDCGYDYDVIDECLGDGPCSVLEMMVALALRCEEDIADDPELGDRTGLWFWSMITNLGLGSMDDSKFDPYFTDEVICRLLNREYGRNGEGGLFTVCHSGHDLRDVEIWCQMCWYLEKI